MFFTSILAVTDFSVGGDHALERAAHLAGLHGATLRLLYAPMPARPAGADPAARLARSAHALSSRFAVTVDPVDAAAATTEDVVSLARGADLLVIHQPSERTLKAFLAGQPAIRLARLCHCPILVVRGPARMRFRRILAAVDFGPPARHLALLACAVDGDAQVELFHAVDTVGELRLRQADVSQDVIKTYRRSLAQYAQARMATLTGSLGDRGTRVLSAIGRGDPARQAAARQAYTGADLLVVGKRRRGALADFLLGSNVRRILGHAACDVLVVPHGSDLRVTGARAACGPACRPG